MVLLERVIHDALSNCHLLKFAEGGKLLETTYTDSYMQILILEDAEPKEVPSLHTEVCKSLPIPDTQVPLLTPEE